MSKKVLVGMSGGVDSSVAAALLVDQGYEVTGVIMKIWDDELMFDQAGKHACFGPDEKEDVEKAQEVCDRLGIELVQVDLKDAYRDTVLDYFSSEYSCGRTPNPCVRCNSRMKFGAMVDRARELGITFDYFATGHYVRKSRDESSGVWHLRKAADHKKDQSYFLYRLDQGQLAAALFPLGDMTKDEVRQYAVKKDLGFEGIPESQDFIGGDYTELLKPGKPGLIVDTDGRELGTHQGIGQYTIGQRRGLGIASRKPLYVVRIDAERNLVYVGTDDELYMGELTADELVWGPVRPETFPVPCRIKVRSQQEPFPAEIIGMGDDSIKLRFANPQRAITPGQSVVIYREDLVLGGGVIQ